MKTRIFAVVAVITMFTSIALADVSVDIKNGNDINNTATGGNAQQDQKQKQDQQQSNNAEVRGNLPEVGFAPFLTSSQTIESSGWQLYCPTIYSQWTMNDLEGARTRFHFWEIFTPWRWGSDVTFTSTGPALPPNSDPISCMNYWPEEKILPGDKVLGIATAGDSDTNDEAFLASAIYACKAEKGSRRVAIIKKEKRDGVTFGKSFGGSGMVSKLDNDADTGAAFATGGMVGKNRTRVEEYSRFKVLCMNDASYIPPPPPPAEVTPPASCIPPVCSPEEIARLQECLRIELDACNYCPNPCINNEVHRKQAGDIYLKLYRCTGNREYLNKAIEQYVIAERDFKNGWEPRRDKHHKHIRTRNIGSAQTVIYKARYNWAWAIRERDGRDDEIAFARSRKLQNTGDRNMPSDYNDLKW